MKQPAHESGRQASTFEEVRRETRRVARHFKADEFIAELGPLSELSLDELKKAQYTIMLAPLCDGVRNYLENPTYEEGSIQTVLDSVSDGVAEEVISNAKSRSAWDAACRINEERFSRIGSIHEELLDLQKSIRGASEFATWSMFKSAEASFTLMQRLGVHGGEYASLLDATRRSTDLPLRWSMAAINWNGPLIESLEWLTTTLRYNMQTGAALRGPNEDALRYDAEKDQVVLSEPIEDWNIPTVAVAKSLGSALGLKQKKLQAIPNPDIHMGCPLSFEPKLVVLYYQLLVDILGHQEGWINGNKPLVLNPVLDGLFKLLRKT